MSEMKALIFDCDGVIAETERDGHRVSFNRTFKEAGIDVEWSVEEYQELLRTAGGKERMKVYFSKNQSRFPGYVFDEETIRALHKRKTEIFMEMSRNGELPVRPGIKRIINEAHEKGLILAVCSTSNEKSVETLIRSSVGEEEFDYFNSIFAGDIVRCKKPAPDIYNLVKEKYGLEGCECFVVEDNRNGLLAAKNAGMHCIVTVSFYSKDEDLKEADMVVSSLGEPGNHAEVLRNSCSIRRDIEYITVDLLKEIIGAEKVNRNT